MDSMLLLGLISGALGLIVPLITELVTKVNAPLFLKSLVTFALSALAAALTTVVVIDDMSLMAYFTAVAAAWLGSMRAYFAGFATPVVQSKRQKAVDGE